MDKVPTEINEDAPLDKELGTLPRKALKNDKQHQSTSQIDYNMHMGGVDRFDQKASYNSIDLKSKLPYMRVVMHLLEVAINNSFLIFMNSASIANKKKFSTALLFRKEVAAQLVSDLRKQNGYNT
jgi:hypothetical protein